LPVEWEEEEEDKGPAVLGRMEGVVGEVNEEEDVVGEEEEEEEEEGEVGEVTRGFTPPLLPALCPVQVRPSKCLRSTSCASSSGTGKLYTDLAVGERMAPGDFVCSPILLTPRLEVSSPPADRRPPPPADPGGGGTKGGVEAWSTVSTRPMWFCTTSLTLF
jgi:hypothetical protein